MRLLGVLLLAALTFAIPAVASAQGVPQVSPEIKQGMPNTSPDSPDFFNFYGVVPDQVNDLTFILAVSNLIGGQAITIDVLPFPFTNLTSRTFAFATRETKFFGPSDLLCIRTVCELFVRIPANAFNFDSLLFLIDVRDGTIVGVVAPFRFAA